MKNSFKKIAIGICTGISAILLAIAYAPDFHPVAYEKLRKSRMIYMVPGIVVFQLSTAIAWLYINTKGEK